MYFAPTAARRLIRIDNGSIVAAGLLLAAFLIRLPHLGSPSFTIDEQFYLLVGDRILHGSVPYVDIWDRKPIGLFLIYALARLLGGAGYVQYQMMATLCAGGTAVCIWRIARPVAGTIGGIVSGILYLLYIEVAEGGGGQSPIFYNLAVAAAAGLVLDACRQEEPSRFSRRAFGAMALVGLAIQIKYTVVMEGAFLGLVLAWQWIRRASAIPALVGIALLALVALAPTLLAFGSYALMGQAKAFWFANFTSIFLRTGTDPAELRYRWIMAALRLIPFTFCILAGMWHLRSDARPETRRWQLFMVGWMIAAVGGFAMVGVLYSHYLLPVFLPFAVAAAPIFRRWPLGIVLAMLAAWIPAIHLDYPDFAATRRSQEETSRLAALVPADVTTGCMQMFDGPPILYYVTHACTWGRFVFPDHLSAAIEAHAIGVDPVAELNRVMALRPRVVTIGDRDVRPPNPATFTVMRGYLTRDYRLAGKALVDGRKIEVWVRH